jgi:hypothetical protein
MKEGSEGFPDPVENKRDREKKAGVKGQLEKGQERFRHPEGNEVHLQIGLIEVTEQRFGKLKEDDHQEDDGDPDLEEAPPETFQSLKDFFPLHQVTQKIKTSVRVRVRMPVIYKI